RLTQSVFLKDLSEQTEVSPRTLRFFKVSSGHLSGGIVNGPNQTKRRPSAFQPIVGAAIDLQHQALGRSSLSTAAMPVRTSLTGGKRSRENEGCAGSFPDSTRSALVP